MPKPCLEIIPDAWRLPVVALLRRGELSCIDWTFRARQDWSQFGHQYQAYDHIVRALTAPHPLGRLVRDMAREGAAEVWEFLSPHPLEVSTPLYVKLSLRPSQVRAPLKLKIISLHIDLTGSLATAAVLRRTSRLIPT